MADDIDDKHWADIMCAIVCFATEDGDMTQHGMLLQFKKRWNELGDADGMRTLAQKMQDAADAEAVAAAKAVIEAAG